MQTVKIYGKWRGLTPAFKTIARMIVGLRNYVAADRCDGYTTLDLPFIGMPRRLRMDSDMNPWTLKIRELNAGEMIKYIDKEDRMFGALLLHAESKQ
jgi:hypothetical protein